MNPLDTLYWEYAEKHQDSDEVKCVYTMLSKFCDPDIALNLICAATEKEAQDAFYAGFRIAAQIFVGGTQA